MRFGLVGTGLMAQEHIRNLALAGDCEVVALVDPRPDSIDWARATLGDHAAAATSFADVPAMLAGLAPERRPEAVIVASPNYTHHAVLGPLFGTGIHILCEKPLATTLADARDIAARAAVHDGVFWVGMEYRFMPPVSRFVEQVHAGRTGRLMRLSIAEHRFPFLPKSCRLEQVQSQHRWHHGGEMLPLLRPDAADRRARNRCACSARAPRT